MTTAVGSLRIDLTADWADFRSELQRVNGAVGKFGTSFQQSAASIARAGAGMFAGFQIGKFISDSVEIARAAEQMENAVSTAFGDSGQEILDWVDSFSASSGLAESIINQQALGFQNLFAEIAPTADAARDASVSFVQLANDFAALKNISPEAAFTAIQQGLSGSARALRAYGIDLSATAVKNEALRAGIISVGQELSAEQAVFVRAAIIRRELADADGALAGSAGDAQDAQNRLRREMEEAQKQIGAGLLPAITAVQQGLAGLIRGYTGAFESLGRWIGQQRGLVILLAQSANLMTGNRHSFAEIVAATEGAGEGVKNFAAEVRAANTTTEDAAQPVDELSERYLGLARQLNNATNSGRAARTWAQEHAADIERLTALIDPVGAALARYTEQSEIARRAGLDLVAVQQELAREAIMSVGGIDALGKQIENLPQSFQDAAAEIAAGEFKDQVAETRAELERFAETLNAEFDTKSAIRAEVEQINAAFAAGLITLDTYTKAIDEATGLADAQRELDREMEREAQNRERAWRRVTDQIADAAVGTREFSDVFRNLVLEFIKAQAIQPFLNQLGGLFSGNGGAKGGKSSGGGGFDWGSLISGIFGGFRANGGGVQTGKAYEVGERGRELFIPGEDGAIVPNGQYGNRTVIQNITTPDVWSFRLSKRALARDERRAFA